LIEKARLQSMHTKLLLKNEHFFPDGLDLKLELVGWKGKASVRAYVPKQERIHYLRLAGGDTSVFEKNKFEIRRKMEATNEKKVEEEETKTETEKSNEKEEETERERERNDEKEGSKSETEKK